MAEDESQPVPTENPFSFTSFLENGSLLLDGQDEVQQSKNNKNAHNRYSYQGNTQSDHSDVIDIFADEDDEQVGEDGNPFSFKEFVKKEKRGGIYLSEGEDSMGEDMGNQHGTAPASGPSQQSPGTTVDGRPRRATSPGLPSRHKHKPTAKGPPPESEEFETPPATPQKTRKGQSKHPDPTAGQTEGDFADFIYNYATQEGEVPEAGGDATPTHQRRDRNGARYSFGDTDAPQLPDKKLYARERARAHTHGHAIRKNKTSPPKPHPKSQLVVDYIDATGEDTNVFSSKSASELQDKGSELPMMDDQTTRPKPHRERARAHSHGQRKQKPNKNKTLGGEQSDRENKHVNGKTSPSEQFVENGNIHGEREQEYERRPSPPRKQEGLYDDLRRGPVRNHSEEKLDEPYDTIAYRKRSPSPAGTSASSSSPSEDTNHLDASPDKLRQENSRIRRELAEARKINSKDAKRIDTMEEELKRLRLREAEDAKTLEAMVQHVEANLKRTTERAVSAENTITNLKKEVKTLKSENSNLLSEMKKFKEGKDLLELKERAHTASLKLAGAAKDAESNLKQLMSGVDTLKLMAQTLACFDKISEQTDGSSDGKKGRKGFGTAL